MKTLMYGIFVLTLTCLSFIIGTAVIMHLQDIDDKRQFEVLKLEPCDSPMWTLAANANGEIWVVSESVVSITEITPDGHIWINETHVAKHNEYAKEFYRCALRTQLLRYSSLR